MHTETLERHGHTRRITTRLVLLFACIGSVAGCATASQSEAPPATAQTEPEPNSVLEKDQQMVFSRESPAPTPEQTATTPQGAATSPTPGALPTLEPQKTKAPAQPSGQSQDKPMCVDC
jgi:hypothetical protein